MSLYADFLNETGVINIIESESGFITYVITGLECYIENIYVVPEKRKTRFAWEMADKVAEIAKLKGCILLTGSINTKSSTPETSLQMLLAYGMKYIRKTDTMIYMGKEI